MASSGKFTDLESLHKWFEAMAEIEGYNTWVLYHGHVMRAGPGSVNAKQYDEDKTVEESWELLKDWIESQSESGGNFTIYMARPGGGGRPGPRAFYTAAKPGVNGIAGIGNVDNYISEKIENFKSQFMLQQEIEALREEMRSKRNVGERLLEQLMESGVVSQLIAGLAAKQFGISGMGQAQEIPYTDAQADTEQQQYSPAQVQRLETSIARLAKHFPRLDVTLSGLADFVEDNPEMAKNFMQNLGSND